jgi:hypothetical protein
MFFESPCREIRSSLLDGISDIQFIHEIVNGRPHRELINEVVEGRFVNKRRHHSFLDL